jgi:alkanesulfonate monooxygenase SsuD/methylene tetrahydromethanopterin reductase-like flavin-dependent oxidoreductase (luciferase family)
MPYHEVVMPEMRIAAEWSARQCEGYIRTWSALEHRRKQRGDSAADEYLDKIKTLWGKETRNIIFPLFFRVGTKEGRVS